MYYLRTKAAVGAIQFTVSQEIQDKAKAQSKTLSPAAITAPAPVAVPVAPVAAAVLPTTNSTLVSTPIKPMPLQPVTNGIKANGGGGGVNGLMGITEITTDR